MASPTGIIPEEYFRRGALRDVMEFLKAMPIPGEDKEKLLFGWAKWVGVRISGSQRAAVRNSGSDR